MDTRVQDTGGVPCPPRRRCRPPARAPVRTRGSPRPLLSPVGFVGSSSFIPSSACQPQSLAPLSAQSLPSPPRSRCRLAHGVGPSARGSCAALDLWVGLLGCPHHHRGALRIREVVRQFGGGPALASRGFLTGSWSSLHLCASPEWRVCTICWAHPREPESRTWLDWRVVARVAVRLRQR